MLGRRVEAESVKATTSQTSGPTEDKDVIKSITQEMKKIEEERKEKEILDSMKKAEELEIEEAKKEN